MPSPRASRCSARSRWPPPRRTPCRSSTPRSARGRRLSRSASCAATTPAFRDVKARHRRRRDRRAAAAALASTATRRCPTPSSRNVDHDSAGPRVRHGPVAARRGDRGDDACSVRAEPQRLGGDLQDPLIVLLESEPAACSSTSRSSSTCRYGYDIRGEVIGETGTVALADPGRGRARRRPGGERVPVDWRRALRPAYDDEFQEWIDALAGGVTRPGPTPGTATPPTSSCDAGASPALRSRTHGTEVQLADRPRCSCARRGGDEDRARPVMFRTTPLLELPRRRRGPGYEYIELWPREDFMPFFLHPRARPARVAAFKARWTRRASEWLGAAAVPVGRPGRGRAPGGGPLLEAGHPDHRRPRLAT